MADEKDAAAVVVGNMGIEEFFSAMLVVLDRAKEKEKTTGDVRLLDLGVGEFTKLMLDQLRSRALATASAETSAAERVLTDWQGLQSVDAITQPFRVKSMDEAVKLGADLAETFREGWRGEIVVAIALTTAPSVYVGRKP